jgi:hypothetical protein
MSENTITSNVTPLFLPLFQKALRPYAADLPVETYRRYANGLLPKAVRLIVENPELAEALAADARTLAAQRKAELLITE